MKITIACLLVIACASSASAGDLVYDASELALMTGHGFDAVSSQRAFAEKRGVEANHWLAQVENPFLFTGVKFAVGGLQLWMMRKLRDAGHPRWAKVANFGTGGLFTTIAIRNERVGR